MSDNKFKTTLEHNFVCPETEKYDRQAFPSHWERYEFALKYCADKNVIDIACGSGCGSSLLASVARNVIGIDIDKNCIEWALRHYGNDAKFLCLDSDFKISVDTESQDLIVSFETIEHVVNPENFISEIARVLKPNGMAIISTPFNDDESRFKPLNPYHLREYNWEEFNALLEPSFIVQQSYSQVSKLADIYINHQASKGYSMAFKIGSLLPKASRDILRSLMIKVRPSLSSTRIFEGYVDGMSVQLRLLVKK